MTDYPYGRQHNRLLTITVEIHLYSVRRTSQSFPEADATSQKSSCSPRTEPALLVTEGTFPFHNHDTRTIARN